MRDSIDKGLVSLKFLGENYCFPWFLEKAIPIGFIFYTFVSYSYTLIFSQNLFT